MMNLRDRLRHAPILYQLSKTTTLLMLASALFSLPSLVQGVGDTTPPAAPGPVCLYSLTPGNGAHGAGSETGFFSITTSSGCTWAAQPLDWWIHTTSSGTGPGTVTYSVDFNADSNQRQGRIDVQGQVFWVTQAGQACAYSISPGSASYGASAGSGGFAVTAPSVCAWTASSDSSWIHTSSKGNGNGVISYTFDANLTLNNRAGGILVGDQHFMIYQSTAPCALILTPGSASFTAEAQSGGFSVSAGNGCGWTASSDRNWIHTSSAGTGNGTVAFTVDANPGADNRSGNVSVGGQVFTIYQSGVTCSLTVTPGSASYTAEGQSGGFAVNAPGGCSWAASSGADWVHTSSAGTGNGTVSFTIDANSGTSTRLGSISLGGQVFTIYQSGLPCTLALIPGSADYTAQAHSGGFSVSSPSGCSWTAQAGTQWIHTSSSGTGNGQVNYTIEANPDSSNRSGSVTVGGQVFMIYQSGVSCSVSLLPGAASHAAKSDSGAFAVSAGPGCPWSAVSGNDWIHTSSTGVGNGSVTYTVEANGTASTRAGAITVGGQTFTVIQAAPTAEQSGISQIPDQHLAISTSSDLIPFKLAGAVANQPSFSFSVQSTDPELLPVDKVLFAGSGSDRFLLLSPTENRAGRTTITISIPVPDDGTVSTSFQVTVGDLSGPIRFDPTGSRADADGRFEVRCSGPAGQALVIQISADLRAWSDLDVVANPTGTVTYTDFSAPGHARRFYRAKPR